MIEPDDAFRCYWCEKNIGHGGWCERCREERDQLIVGEHLGQPITRAERDRISKDGP